MLSPGARRGVESSSARAEASSSVVVASAAYAPATAPRGASAHVAAPKMFGTGKEVGNREAQWIPNGVAPPHLDGYSVAFGRVVSGMDVVHRASKVFSIRGKPVEPVVMEKIAIIG